MTVSTTSSTTVVLGNGSDTVFDFNFIGVSSSDIEVIFTDTDGTITTLSPSQYTVILNAAATGQIWGIGGTITYPLVGSPIASGTSLTISRILPLTQTITISNQGDFAPQVIEEMGDTLEMQIQQIAARTGQFRGTWITATSYNFGDIVIDGANGNDSGSYYMCIIANTSGTWSADLMAGDWTLIIQATVPVASLPISVPNGGTGVSTLTSHSVLIGEGSSNVGFATVGTSGRIFIDQGPSSDPAFETMSGDATMASSGAITVAANAITNAKLATMAAQTVKVNATGGSATPTDLALSINTVVGRSTSGNIVAVPLPASGIVASSRNLIIKQLSNTTMSVVYDEVIAKTGLGGQAYLGASGSFTLDFGVNGANGLDAGAIGISAQYYIYSIFNPSSVTWATLASLSASAPTLPSGYTAASIIGITITDGSAHIPASTQYDREFFWASPQVVFTNQAGVSTLTSQSIAGAVPSQFAKTCSGIFTANLISSVTNKLQVAADVTGTGLQQGSVVTSSTVTNITSETLNFRSVPMITNRVIFINMGNTSANTNSLSITSFTF